MINLFMCGLEYKQPKVILRKKKNDFEVLHSTRKYIPHLDSNSWPPETILQLFQSSKVPSGW